MSIKLCDHCKKTNKIYSGRVVYIPKYFHVGPELVKSLRKRGVKIRRIAEKFNITDRRVHQILQQS